MHGHFYENLVTYGDCDVLSETGTPRTNAKSQTTSIVNKGPNMLHKLNFDTNSMAISHWQILEQVYMNIFLFGD